MEKNIKNIVYIAVSAALICIATFIIKFPLPVGYVNFGDGVIIALSNVLGFGGAIAAAIGSGLADLIAGYPVYIPATAIIKALVALIIFLPQKSALQGKKLILRSMIAELVMVLGYFLYESIIYNVAAASSSILGNTVQGVFAVALGYILYNAIKKIKL